MNIWKKFLSVTALVAVISLFATQATAQDKAAKDAELERVEQTELKMREAERQMEAAARQIAELSRAALARVEDFDQHWILDSTRPVLGITIGTAGEDGLAKGAVVIGISPGGAADEAGIRSGDIITAINGESLSSDSSSRSNELLIERMSEVAVGEEVDLDYLRNKSSVSVKVTPEAAVGPVLDFRFRGLSPMIAPGAPHVRSFAWIGTNGGHGFGEMEMVELNKSLGRYFGTDSGLLIVKAPRDNAYQLQDGDVLKSIDGRTPEDLMHAIRILSSYEDGEVVNLKILRDKKEKTITVEVPDDRQSRSRTSLRSLPTPVLMRGVAPQPEVLIVPRVKVVRKLEHST